MRSVLRLSSTARSTRGGRTPLLAMLVALSRAVAAGALAVACLLALAGASSAQAGASDPTFNVFDNGYFGHGPNNVVRALVVQPDGKVLVAGDFDSYTGASRNRVARLNPDGGLDASFSPGSGANDQVEALALQPDGKVLIGGSFSAFGGIARNGIARLNPDGSLDASFDPGAGASATVYAVALQPDGKVLIGGWFTSFDGVARSRIARLNADGSLDASFNPGAGASSYVYAFALQPDGKVLICGQFTSFDGAARHRIARLNADGSLDASFDAGTYANNAVRALGLQPDGKVLIGGSFTDFHGAPSPFIARLNADGSHDPSFSSGTGPAGSVFALARQSDGKLLIVGTFTSVDGVGCANLARLNADGSLDASFNAAPGFDANTLAVALQPDGKALVGGHFSAYQNTACNRIVRIESNGAVDASFNPGAGADQRVRVIVAQPDGKLLLAGDFTSFNGVDRAGLARANADGSLDASFDPGAGTGTGGVFLGGSVNALALQLDGKLLIGGQFVSYDGVNRRRIARVNADGSLDASFAPGTGADSTVHCLALQSDGRVLIGGSFNSYDGTARARVARLNADGSLDASFNANLSAGHTYDVLALALQPDGKVLIGGSFNTLAAAHNGILRVNSDGSLDASFNPGAGATNGSLPSYVATLALQPDGRVLVGGEFTSFGVTLRPRIARVNPNGSLDASFNPLSGANAVVRALAVQANGRVLVGGGFATFNGVARSGIARVNANGSLDASFNPGGGVTNGAAFTTSRVHALALQGDGRLLIGGDFTAYDGAVRHRIARVLTVAPGVTTSYCTSGTSAIGCTPTMSASGVASASATSGYVVTTSNIEGLRQTNTFYSVLGPRTPATPFGAGLLCVKTPTQRIGSVLASGTPGQCNGSVSIDVLAWAQAHPGAQGMPFTFGTTLNFQCAIRDPLSPGTRVMSDALQVTLAP